MRNYLSYGGGVNSVAMLLLLQDEGVEFESIYVDHGCDWPETREYNRMMLDKGYKITTVPAPGLWEKMWKYRMVPSMQRRWCTADFKVKPIAKYVEIPCFMMLGISSDEAHRAKMQYEDGIERRFPLIEREVDREGCKRIILDHGLPLPIKSGCWFCPMQTVRQWRLLRQKHPDLFCKAKQLEDRNMEYRRSKGKKPLYLYSNGKPLDEVVNENQEEMFPEFKPPCHCEL